MDTVNLGLLTRKCFEAVNDHVTAGVEYEQCTQYQPESRTSTSSSSSCWQLANKLGVKVYMMFVLILIGVNT